MEASHKTVNLTSAEISNLWSTYMNDSLVICVLTHFLNTVEDRDAVPVLEKGIGLARSHTDDIKVIFDREGIARPKAFPVEEHVDLSAPRLFSDIFYMEYLQHMSKVGLMSHSSALATSSRKDIRLLFEKFMGQAAEINHAITELMISKGIYIRPPYMNYPKSVDFVEKQNFLTGWLGKRRPLLGVEVSHLYLTSYHNQVGKSSLHGFAQVARDQDLREYFLSGAQLSAKILTEAHEILQESNIPDSMTWDVNVSESTVPPFSDQLMLFLVLALSQLGISAYGTALSTNMRRDLGGIYLNFLLKAIAYSEDGAQMIINRGWMEQPPTFTDRERLIKEAK